MTAVLAFLLRAAIETVRNPREGARRVMAVQMARQDRWEVLILVAVLSAALAYVSVLVSGVADPEAVEVSSIISPAMLGVSQLIVMVVMVFSMYQIGRWAGGDGGFDDAILLVTWMQFVLICLQVAQILAVLVFPVLALLLGLVGLVLVFVLLTLFSAELHGFRSVTGVFFSVLFVMLILATLIRFLFSLFGFEVIGVF